jgi:formylglycine-generating enzyme required for sulfatase activity
MSIWPGQGRRFLVPSPHVSGSGPDQGTGSVPAAQVKTTVTGVVPRWVEVPGGVLPERRHRAAFAIEDLQWSATPLTWGQARALLPSTPVVGNEDLPITGISQAQARLLAEAAGGRLPTSEEWEWMAGGGTRRYPWGNTVPDDSYANLRQLGPGRPTSVGAYPLGATPHGLLDVAGNVWEWTATQCPGQGAIIKGGSYNSIVMYAQCAYANDVPAAMSSYGIGVRVVREP